jgi:hypothetical protein
MHVLAADVAEIPINANAELIITGFEITHEEKTPSGIFYKRGLLHGEVPLCNQTNLLICQNYYTQLHGFSCLRYEINCSDATLLSLG